MASPVTVLMQARSWMWSIFAHNHAEQLRIQREVQRKQLGLESQDYPYPGAVQGSNNPTTIHVSGGWLKGALLGAALLSGGAAAGTAWLKQAPPPGESNGSPADQAYDAVYEQQQPDGSWRQIKRERLKP